MLQRLVLDYFRNYTHGEIAFDPGVNFLLGANGQGKTNILEAIYFLSLLRSFRTSQTAQLSTVGHNAFSLYSEITDAEERQLRLGVQYGASQRMLMVDGTPVGRSSEFISHVVCTAFIPEDLEIVKGTPGGRRRFLNIALCQRDMGYLRSLQAYNDALHARNEMLKHQEKYPRETVTAYDTLLVEQAMMIEEARRGMAEAVNRELEELSKLFFPDGRQLSVQYLSGCQMLLEQLPEDISTLKKNYEECLKKNYERDCRDGATRFGCHRSDLACLINGRLLSFYGSEGECRTAALALRFAVSRVLRTRVGEAAMVTIIDDVIGELDDIRREAFIHLLMECGQVIFAGTAVPQELAGKCRLFTIRGGTIAP